MKPHNVDRSFIKGYTQEDDIRIKKSGSCVSLIINSIIVESFCILVETISISILYSTVLR